MQIKKMLVLSGVALLALTGCAKEITQADAAKYADENFSGEAVETAGTSKIVSGEFSGVFSELKEDFKDEEKSISELLSPIDSTFITRKFSSPYKFYLDGNILSAKIDANGSDLQEALKQTFSMKLPDNAELSGTIYACMTFNAKGYIHSDEFKLHFNMKVSEGGITLEGSLNVERTVTYNN